MSQITGTATTTAAPQITVPQLAEGALTAGQVQTGTAVVASPLANQQAQQLPAGETASVVVVVALGFLLWRAVEHGGARWIHLIMAFTAGVLLAGSVVGQMADQLAGSLGQAAMSMLTTVTGTGS